jgi:transcriptional regulator with XRE-family HTH domain
MSLGQRIRQARQEAGLSQRQLCGDVITRNMLSQIENGGATPSMATLQYLADRLGKSISFFLEETVASPNQPRMDTARAAFAAGDPATALSTLEQYTAPDPIFDAERYLLEALACMALAQNTPDPALLARAAAAGARTPYYTPDLERRRLLIFSRTPDADLAAIAADLSDDDDALFLRAQAALRSGDALRCAQLLDAAEDRSSAPWLLLRGDAAAAADEDTLALSFYKMAEPLAPKEAWPRLEQCFLRLEDYKMAYFYACKQR